jgi:hypothetical protein
LAPHSGRPRSPRRGVCDRWGLGVALPVTLGTDLLVGSVPPERAGVASGTWETGAELGGALGIAILGEDSEAARETLSGAVAAAEHLPDALGPHPRIQPRRVRPSLRTLHAPRSRRPGAPNPRPFRERGRVRACRSPLRARPSGVLAAPAGFLAQNVCVESQRRVR